MANSKWFYNLQKKAKIYLKNNYDAILSCNSQDIQKDFVYETYTCLKNEKTIYVMVLLNKREQVAIYEMQCLFHV
jgi:hypothetical protein